MIYDKKGQKMLFLISKLGKISHVVVVVDDNAFAFYSLKANICFQGTLFSFLLDLRKCRVAITCSDI